MMKKMFSEQKNISKCSIIKQLVSKTEGSLVSRSLHKYTQYFFAAIDHIKKYDINDRVLHSDISLEDFIETCVTQETIKSILKYKNYLSANQIKYFEDLGNLSAEHFNAIYSQPLKFAYSEYGFLFKPTLSINEKL